MKTGGEALVPFFLFCAHMSMSKIEFFGILDNRARM